MGSDSVLVAIISENFREICRIVSAGAVLTHLNDRQTDRQTHTHPDRGSFLFLGKNPILWNGIKKQQNSERKFYDLSIGANFIFRKRKTYTERLSDTRLGYLGQQFLGNVQFQLSAKIERVHISKQIRLILVETFIVF